jgi:hypothetical protein
MTEEDAMIMRDFCAFLAMQGYLANGDYHPEEIPERAYEMADSMIEARNKKPTVGLPAIQKRRRK